MSTIRYVTDATGQTTDVIVPISVWREIIADDGELDETERIRANPAIHKRILEAMERGHRGEGISYEEVRARLNI